MFEHIFKHLEVHQKYSAMSRIFKVIILFSVFGNKVKHGLSCLIHYISFDYGADFILKVLDFPQRPVALSLRSPALLLDHFDLGIHQTEQIQKDAKN